MHPFLIVSVQWYVVLWSKRCVFSSRGLHQCTAGQTLSSWVKRKHTCWFAWSSCNQLLLTSRNFLDDQLHVAGSTLTTKHTGESFQLESNQTLFIWPLQCYLVIFPKVLWYCSPAIIRSWIRPGHGVYFRVDFLLAIHWENLHCCNSTNTSDRYKLFVSVMTLMTAQLFWCHEQNLISIIIFAIDLGLILTSLSLAPLLQIGGGHSV